jgi:hypothetical protein
MSFAFPANGGPWKITGELSNDSPTGVSIPPDFPYTATMTGAKHAVTITGHVSGSDGKPYADLNVHAVDDGDQTDTGTNREGVFVLRDVKSGPVVIRLVSGDCHTTVARETVNAESSITVKYVVPAVILTGGTSEHLVATACGVPANAEGFTFETKLIGSRVKNGSCTDAKSEDVKRYRPSSRVVTARFELPSSSDRFCNGAYHMTVFGDDASGVESAAKRFNIVQGDVLDRSIGTKYGNRRDG